MAETYEMQTALDDFAGDVAEPACWISGEWRTEGGYLKIYTDEAADWCRECAEAIVALIKRASAPSEEDEPLIGESAFSESDGCRHCQNCGQLLTYTLTDYGAREELGHFRENPVAGPLSPETAFHIARLIAAMPEDDPEAMKIAAAAYALIPARAKTDPAP